MSTLSVGMAMTPHMMSGCLNLTSRMPVIGSRNIGP